MADLLDRAVEFVKSPEYVDLTTRQLAILAVVMNAPQPPRVRELALALHVQKPVVTRSLDTLMKLGLVERHRGHDRRDRFIHVTDAGRAFRAALGGAA